MPVNRDALYRFRIIDQCLRNAKRVWTVEYLLEVLNNKIEFKYGEGNRVVRSTLLSDLEAMTSLFEAPIDYYTLGKKNVYYYTIENYGFFNIPITAGELEYLKDGAHMLRQKQGLTTGIGLSEIVRKLENQHEPSEIGRQIISFQGAPKIKGLQHLDYIYKCIKQQKVITILHQPFGSDKQRQWIIHPYLLKEDDHRWYIFGYVPEKEHCGIFGLERISTVSTVDVPYIESTLEDNEDYFRHVLGVTVFREEEVQDIELLFSPKMKPYIQTRPLHLSQATEEAASGHLIARYLLKINPELISRILSYGPEVKVLQPQRLVDEVKTALKNTLVQYE